MPSRNFRNAFVQASPGLGRGLGSGLGAAIGTYALPGVGTALGAGLGETIGGLAGNLASAYFEEDDPRQIAMREAQDELLAQLRQRGQYDFNPIYAGEQRRFNEETVPALAERFTALGGGAGRSSAFGQSLGRAGADLSERLAGLKAGHQLQVANLDQNRLAALQNFLGGQQNLAQGNYQFGQNLGMTQQQLGQNYGLERQRNLMAGLGLGLGQQYENVWNPGRQGLIPSFMIQIPSMVQAGASLAAGIPPIPNLGQQKS